MSGNLTWTPVHTEVFWRENINKFDQKGFALIKQLVLVLDDSKDEMALEVACYDLGEFARFHPDGKRIIEGWKGKGKLMALLNHQNPGVRKQALLCVQKMMVQNWQFLEKGGQGAKGGAGAKDKGKGGDKAKQS